MAQKSESAGNSYDMLELYLQNYTFNTMFITKSETQKIKD